MPYLDNKSKILKYNIKNFTYLTSGSTAHIYHNQKIIIKTYFPETKEYWKLTKDVFDILKNIKDNHFIELYNIYTKINLYKLLHIENFTIDLYTAKYYQNTPITLINQPINYTLENIKELEKLFTTFTQNSILTDDLKKANTILTKDKIIIIDPDAFRISPSSPTKLSITNKSNLLKLFRNICLKEIKDYPNYGKKVIKIDTDLTNIEIQKETNITDELYKKLKPYKTPIDYLNN